MKQKPLFNIFSKTNIKLKKELKKEKIIIDYREKNCMVFSELVKNNLDIEFKELKIGDYIVKDIVIERKTVNDFISSMMNGRLRHQLQEIQQYPNKLLIIEGIDEQELYTNSQKKIGVNSNAIRGFLLSILLNYKVPLIFTKNSEDTAKFITILSRKKKKELPLNVMKKTLNKKEQLQFIIESFPGIGPKTSRKLLKEFKTIKNIINSSEQELKKVLGKKSEIIKKIIEMNYN
jgi:ERCC4-type nuclease